MGWVGSAPAHSWSVVRNDVPLRNKVRVSLWDATHCRSARALQTLLEAAAVSCEGLSSV